MADPEATGGEAGAEPTGTTASATDGQANGQSGAPVQTTGSGTEQSGESFFDYESIRGKPELEGIYKEMQRGLTAKSEVYKAGADKIRQYDQIMSDPMTAVRQYAQQNGYQMVQGQPQAADDGKPRTYNSWEEVEAAADERADKRFQEKFGPMFSEMQNMKQQNVEQSLDNSHPDWRTYEDQMMAKLQAHPSLVNDPDMLYRMSVPQSVLDARANKAALARIQGTTESGKVQGQSTTTQQATAPVAATSFDDAVKIAKASLKSRGMTPPRE